MRTVGLISLLVGALGLAGCAAGVGFAPLFVLFAAALVIGGCSDSEKCGDGKKRGNGSCDTCCIDGTLSTCYCPANYACNYDWNSCMPDGGNDGSTDAATDASEDASTDASPDGTVDGASDAATDAGGTWDPCCVEGRIETCFCPAGAACNYGMGLVDCGGGRFKNLPTAVID